MSGTPPARTAGRAAAGPPVRRVRHEVRDQVAVVLFSLAASALVALGLTVVSR